jgi:hypothetical protein
MSSRQIFPDLFRSGCPISREEAHVCVRGGGGALHVAAAGHCRGCMYNNKVCGQNLCHGAYQVPAGDVKQLGRCADLHPRGLSGLGMWQLAAYQ